MDEGVVVAISALEHHEYCPRQCGLIHVDGFWDDNVQTIAGTRAHRRVDSGVSRSERGRSVLRSIPLWSERFGLSGRADAVEVLADGRVQPVEYKSGRRHGLTADLQLCAQALCLEEMLAVEIDVGFIWYGGTRRRHRVDLGRDLRVRTIESIAAVREMIVGGRLPLAVNDTRCGACQVRHHCLPELTDGNGAAEIGRYLDGLVRACAT